MPVKMCAEELAEPDDTTTDGSAQLVNQRLDLLQSYNYYGCQTGWAGVQLRSCRLVSDRAKRLYVEPSQQGAILSGVGTSRVPGTTVGAGQQLAVH
jgi:hypothetical protein